MPSDSCQLECGPCGLSGVCRRSVTGASDTRRLAQRCALRRGYEVRESRQSPRQARRRRSPSLRARAFVANLLLHIDMWGLSRTWLHPRVFELIGIVAVELVLLLRRRERCGRVGAHANVRGEVDDFEVFVEHVKARSADEDFGVSRRKLDLGGHHGEEELTVGERPPGVGSEVFESEIVLLAVIIHRGDWGRNVDVGVCGECVCKCEFICMTYRALFASLLVRSEA